MDTAEVVEIIFDFHLPHDGPSLEELAVRTERYSRDLPDFAAYAMFYFLSDWTYCDEEDAFQLYSLLAIELELLRRQRLKHHRLKFSFSFEECPFDLTDLDQFALWFGTSRDMMLSAMFIVALEQNDRLRDDPVEQAYWAEIARMAEQELRQRQGDEATVDASSLASD